jgi:hypothetical protein
VLIITVLGIERSPFDSRRIVASRDIEALEKDFPSASRHPKQACALSKPSRRIGTFLSDETMLGPVSGVFTCCTFGG